MSRQEDIDYNILTGDRIWPPFVGYDHNHPFVKALVEVLTRLPDEDYDAVEEFVYFVVETREILAINVPLKMGYPSVESNSTIRFETIVIFHSALKFPHKALIGLIAHEVAHSFVDIPDHKRNEQETDLQVNVINLRSKNNF